MPFYEYECQACHRRFEALVSLAEREREEAELRCPKCGTPHPKRMISSFSTGSPSSGSGSACAPGG